MGGFSEVLGSMSAQNDALVSKCQLDTHLLGRREVRQHLLLRDLRVVDVQVAAIADEALADVNGRRLARVTGVLQHACISLPCPAEVWPSQQLPWLIAVHAQQLWRAAEQAHAPTGGEDKRGTFLKAKPRIAMRLPEMVLNIDSMTRSTKRCF
jgi:hypothetical protein